MSGDVYLQGFYWNSPPGGIWWQHLAEKAPQLASAGFGGIWIPSPVKGAGGGFSMGYDPYDHYDFGEYDQKGSIETRFGSRSELLQMIETMHQAGIEVYADAVMNHLNGGEALIPYECKPYPEFPDSGWLLFEYPRGSGRFPKNAAHFYPNSQTCDVNPDYHGASDPIFQFGEWLAHDRDFVRDSLIVWGQYLRNVIGFDGFRLDAVKGIDPAFMGPWLAEVNADGGFAVAEYYGGIDDIKYWLNMTLYYGGNVAMFDFPLRFTLKDMCMNSSGSFDMRNLDGAGLVNNGVWGYNVSTFVENHDFDRIGWNGEGADDPSHSPIINDKALAYAYILFSEGKPTIFYKDYFEYGLQGKIDTLIYIRNKYLGGGTEKRAQLNAWFIREDGSQDQNALSPDAYVARRTGYLDQPGGYLFINDHPTLWMDAWVNVYDSIGTVYRDFTGKDNDKIVAPPDGSGPNRIKLWAPPRSYTVYVADTSRISRIPVLNPLPDFQLWTLAPFEFAPIFSDADGDIVEFQLQNAPAWLHVTESGILHGTPAYPDTGFHQIIFTISDALGQAAADTFSMEIKPNLPPQLVNPGDLAAKATERFQFLLEASDPDGDTLVFSIITGPLWLNVGLHDGLLSGTPALEDTGIFLVEIEVGDGKGLFDSTQFYLTVNENTDSLIGTYGKPLIDGTVNDDDSDWLAEWKIAADSADDSAWRDSANVNNELYGLYATWDADSLYIGVDYFLDDPNNTLMLYMNWLPNAGVNYFHSSVYFGDHAKNIVLPDELAADGFVAAYNQTAPGFWKMTDQDSDYLGGEINGRRGSAGHDLEAAIAWNSLFGLGAGLLTPNATIDFVAVVAGGYNWGAGDALPDNPDVDGNSGPDTLWNWVTITPDEDGDGLPDPTVWILTSIEEKFTSLPQEFALLGNYPNPFNPQTQIRFAIPKAALVKLSIYNMQGQKIAGFQKNYSEGGVYNILWNGRNQQYEPVSSGVYFYQIQMNQQTLSGKMLLLK